MKKYRYTLRNKYKLEKAFGIRFMQYLRKSLDKYFNENAEIKEYAYDNDNAGYNIIHVNNVQENTDSTFEFYIIKKTFDVYLLAYKGVMG